MQIGNVILPHGLILGPMAGYTDRAMRLVCRSFGAEYAVTEMVSAKAVCYGDRKTYSLARILPDEGPVALQIFGSEPQILAEGAAMLLRHAQENGEAIPAAIDVNMGCPVRKIFGNGEGSALMRDPARILEIVSAIRRAVPLPVTVKLRSGVDPSHINAVECALAAEEGGAAAVAIHGRCRTQLYGGNADPAVGAAVKAALSIPVIWSGDVRDPESALRLKAATGADGLMIARAAVGDPFLFARVAAAMEGREIGAPSFAERRRVALRQLSLASEEKGEEVAVSECRKQIAAYFTGERGCAALRDRVHRAKTIAEVEEAIAGVGD